MNLLLKRYISYFWHGILLINTSIVNRNIKLFLHVYYETLIAYTVERTTRASTALATTTLKRPFSRIVAPYLILFRTRSVLEVLSMKEGGFAPKLQTDAFKNPWSHE